MSREHVRERLLAALDVILSVEERMRKIASAALELQDTLLSVCDAKLSNLPQLEIQLGEGLVPKLLTVERLYAFLKGRVEAERRAPLAAVLTTTALRFIYRVEEGGAHIYCTLKFDELRLIDVLKVAMLEELNPGLLHRLAEEVESVRREWEELREKLRRAAALLELALK